MFTGAVCTRAGWDGGGGRNDSGLRSSLRASPLEGDGTPQGIDALGSRLEQTARRHHCMDTLGATGPQGCRRGFERRPTRADVVDDEDERRHASLGPGPEGRTSPPFGQRAPCLAWARIPSQQRHQGKGQLVRDDAGKELGLVVATMAPTSRRGRCPRDSVERERSAASPDRRRHRRPEPRDPGPHAPVLEVSD